MRTGESSTIPVVISVAVAGICVALAVWSYTLLGDEEQKLSDATKQLDQSRKEKNALQTTLRKVAETSTGDNSVTDTLPGLIKALDSFNENQEKPDRRTDVLAALTHQQELYDALRRRAESLEQEKVVQKKALEVRIEAAKNEVTAKEKKLQEQQEQLAAARENWEKNNKGVKKEYARAKSDMDANIKALQADLREARTNLVRSNKKVDDLETRITALTITIKAQEESPLKAGEVATDERIFQPDGKVIRTWSDSVAIIDIGSDDGVKTAMIFRVYYTEGNDRKLTSMGIVKKVEKSLAVLRLYKPGTTPQGFRESDRPVVKGNYVATPMPLGRKTVFFLDGTFNTTTKWGLTLSIEDLKSKILEYGGALSREISVETDIVVLGVGYKNVNLKKANRLGKKIISKADILDFLAARDS